MTKLNKTEVAEFLELKKERLEKLRNFIEIANEKSLYELADESKLFVRRLFCGEGKCRNVRLTHRLNKFSTNIDAIGVQLNIIV